MEEWSTALRYVKMARRLLLKQHDAAFVVMETAMTTTQNEDSEQTSSTSDTVQPAEGMVYSAVIRQDGKKTSVKVTVE